MKKTLAQLEERARNAIERREEFIYDVASESGSIVGNVAHMHWFRLEVMRHLASESPSWEHLFDEVEQKQLRC